MSIENKVIVYPQENGIVAIVNPSRSSIEGGLTMEEIAAKSVPAGVPYKIIDISEVPSDRVFRDAWEYVEWV